MRGERQAAGIEEIQQQLERVRHRVGERHRARAHRAPGAEEPGAAGENRPVSAELAAANTQRGVTELPGCALPVQLPQHTDTVSGSARHGRNRPEPEPQRHRNRSARRQSDSARM